MTDLPVGPDSPHSAPVRQANDWKVTGPECFGAHSGYSLSLDQFALT
jgi:hypothetical protein